MKSGTGKRKPDFAEDNLYRKTVSHPQGGFAWMSSVNVPAPISLPFTLKTVIYATDFTPRSENAGRYAALLAREFGAELLVAHTFVLTQGAMEAEAEARPPAKSYQRRESEAELAKVVRHYGKGLREASSILLEGDPQEQLPRIAGEKAPSIVVVGTEGRGRLGRSVVHSVAERVLRSTGGPALTVGPHVAGAATDVPHIRRVLFATTLEPGAVRGGACAIGMAEAFHAQMDVLQVVPRAVVGNTNDLENAQRKFQQQVDALFPGKATGIPAPRGVIEIGRNAPQRIRDYVRENSIDLLVLALHWSAHAWLESLASDAFDIIADAPCPVMTILG
jgi:nucleotide-binding universal stress UspA family protein